MNEQQINFTPLCEWIEATLVLDRGTVSVVDCQQGDNRFCLIVNADLLPMCGIFQHAVKDVQLRFFAQGHYTFKGENKWWSQIDIAFETYESGSNGITIANVVYNFDTQTWEFKPTKP